MTNNTHSHFEAWAQSDNLWLVKIDTSGLYETADGNQRSLYYGEYLIDPNIPMYRVEKVITITGYEDKEGNFKSVEAYGAELTELQNKGRKDDYDDAFDNLEDEYAFRKFKLTWTPIKDTKETKTLVTFSKVHEVPRDVNDYITPERKISGNPKDTLFVYKIKNHITKVVEEELSKFYTITDLDNVRFAKIDNEYITIKIPQTREWLEPLSQSSNQDKKWTKEDCIAKFQKVENEFRLILQNWVKGRSNYLRDTRPFENNLLVMKEKAVGARAQLAGRNKKVEDALNDIIRHVTLMWNTIQEINKFDK